jgi:hypothetical protein
MSPAVLLPAGFIRYGAERFFFSVADGFDAVAGNTSLYQSTFDRIGAIGTESKVIFRRAALVGMAFNRDVNVGVLLQELGI